ncbi:hypothetical protein PENSPDRAFT_688036 [Peniophora sp. CONT]|nr:hypothetical protein PENSPDRAFT_688036 [Peniophora sp. CONT]
MSTRTAQPSRSSLPSVEKKKLNVVETLAFNPCIHNGPITSGKQALVAQIERGRFSGRDADECIKRVFLQVLNALRFLHMHTIAHSSICAERVIALDATGLKYALCGFEDATTETSIVAKSKGIRAYMAPECWARSDNKTYDPRTADIWALGVLLVQIMTGTTPWDVAQSSDARFVSACVWGVPALKHLHVTRQGKQRELSSLLFALNPAERITLDELASTVQSAKKLQKGAKGESGVSGWKLLRSKTVTASSPVASSPVEAQKDAEETVTKKMKGIEQRLCATEVIAQVIARPDQAAKRMEALKSSAFTANIDIV